MLYYHQLAQKFKNKNCYFFIVEEDFKRKNDRDYKDHGYIE